MQTISKEPHNENTASIRGKFCFTYLTDCNNIATTLFVVTRYDVDRCLNLGPSEMSYHVHLVDHSTRVGVLLFATIRLCYTLLTRANQLETAVHGCHILLILGLVSIMSLSTQSDQHCRNLSQKYVTHKICHTLHTFIRLFSYM